MKVILQENYKGYENALNSLYLETLAMRRENLFLKFAQECVRNKKTKHMFPLIKKNHNTETKISGNFKVYFTITARLKRFLNTLHTTSIRQEKGSSANNANLLAKCFVSKIHANCPSNKTFINFTLKIMVT